MNNKLLLIFSEKIFTKKSVNLVKLDEQLQIAFQILINNGYQVLVSGDGDKSFEFAKKFSYIFQDENIKNAEGRLNESQKAEFIKKSDCIVCFQEEEVKLAKSLNSQYIFINIEEGNIKEEFDGFTIKSLNAGEIVKKVEELLCDVFDLEDNYSAELNDTKSDVTTNSSGEFEEYKNQIKKTIEELINDNELNKAKNLIVEYESIVKGDQEIYSLKAIIAIKENRLNDSKVILIDGIELFENNFDLTYNLAYVYEILGEHNDAIVTYDKALKLTHDYELRKQIYNIINNLKM